MTGFKKIYSAFERKPVSEFDPGADSGSRQALTSKREAEARRCFNRNETT
jgi:hypothetical protein